MALIEPSQEFRELLRALADAAQAKLGLSDTRVALVYHRATDGDGTLRYDVGVACDVRPDLVRVMRGAFPRAGKSPFRVFMGPFGDLNLEGASTRELQAALAKLNS